MKLSSTSTHILGLVLAVVGAASCSAHSFHHQYRTSMRGVSHDELIAEVKGVGHGLLHPLDHYALKFIGWALEHGVWFDSLTEGVHALEVSCASYGWTLEMVLWMSVSLSISPSRGVDRRLSCTCCSVLGAYMLKVCQWEECRNEFSCKKSPRSGYANIGHYAIRSGVQ